MVTLKYKWHEACNTLRSLPQGWLFNEEGLIVGIPILVKKAHPALVREVYFAMKQWRFEPVLILGKPASFETEMAINFVPPNKKKKNPAP